MDTLSPNNGSKSSSSGSSAASSSMDLGKHQQKEQLHRHPRCGPKKLSRSRSLLQLLSKHLGKHFHHQNHQNETVYSSQDDIRSSSTDSFSLSYERGSHECPINGSSLDLEHTSRTSSGSACSRYSPGLDYYDQQGHIYVEAVYRPGSAMEQLHPQLHFEEDSSEGEGEGEGSGSGNEAEDEVELGTDENENAKPRSASSASASAKSSGLHLSRISISSSVSRMLQHFSSPTGNASMRSLSCSSTPLRQPKKSLSANNSNSSSSSSQSGSSSKSSGGRPASKKEKKQQSILRPPVQYVSLKGMSGLYSRVPSYAVCYPYTLQHMY